MVLLNYLIKIILYFNKHIYIKNNYLYIYNINIPNYHKNKIIL